MRGILGLLSPSLLTGIATALACRSAHNPELIVPPAAAPSSLRLEGTVLSLGSSQPLVGASLQLIANPGKAEKSDTQTSITQPDGAFVFDSLASGRYLLITRSIGHRARYDTLVLSMSPPPRLTIP